MVTTLCYKVIDLSPHSDAWPARMEDVLNEQAQEGWELVTGFERTHEALVADAGVGRAGASAAQRLMRMTHAATHSEYVDHLGMPSRGLLGGSLLGTATGPLSHGEWHGDGRVARLDLSGALLSSACHLYHGVETGTSR
jgi:iron uptake system EfeUOB component EfeO/EfeM